MRTIAILLPEPLRKFVDGEIESGRYSSASEYIQELIREDEKHKAEERVEALLVEGLQGQETALIREDWNALRQEALAKLKARKNR